MNLLESVEWKIALKTALAGSISLFLSFTFNHYFKRPDYIISGLWAAVAAIVVQQAHLGSTYKSAWLRFLGVLIGSVMGGLFTTLLGSNPLSLGIAIFLTIVICSVFNIKESLRIACLSVAVVMILWGLRPMINPWVFGFYRFLDSCLGIIVAVGIAHLLWPTQVSRKLSIKVADVIEYVRQALFSSSSPTEARQALKSANELIWKCRQLTEDSKLELLSTYGNLEEWKFLFNHLDVLVDRVFLLSKTKKENLFKILDEGISNYLKDLLAQIEKYLQYLAQALMHSQQLPEESNLRQALDNLNNDLERFRTTRKTRSFSFEDVEGFFVYLYTLRSFVEELFKMRKHIDNIMSD